MRQFGLASLLMLGTALAGARTAQAVLITFDTAGYDASGSIHTVDGNTTGKAINSQGDSTHWGDVGINLAVVANAGSGGGDNNALVTATTQLNSQSVIYNPSPAELGITAFHADSQQNFSLDIKLISDGGLSASTQIYRLYIGLQSSSVYPVYLDIRANGTVRADNSSSNALLTMSSALLDGDYHTLSGVIDYTTQKVAYFLDGASQGSAAFATTGETSYGGFKFNARRNGLDSGQTTTDGSGIALDNISAAVPEPATAALLGLCGAFGILYRRRGSARKQAR